MKMGMTTVGTMKIGIGRSARGAMIALAMVLGACGSDRAGDDAAAPPSDSSAAPVAPPVATAPDSAPAAPADSASAGDAGNWVLRADGIGPVRVGMTVAEADKAVGGLNRTSGLEQCDYVQAKNGPARVAFMVQDSKIARVDVRDSATVMTVAGVRPGESEAAARQAYPNARVQPHKYEERGHYIVVIPGAPADTLHRLVFETNGTVVTRMRGGLFPAVEFVEGCS